MDTPTRKPCRPVAVFDGLDLSLAAPPWLAAPPGHGKICDVKRAEQDLRKVTGEVKEFNHFLSDHREWDHARATVKTRLVCSACGEKWEPTLDDSVPPVTTCAGCGWAVEGKGVSR